MDHTSSLPVHACIVKCEESLAEDLVLFTKDCLSATSAPTQEQLQEMCWLFSALSSGDLDCCRAVLKGGVSRPLRPDIATCIFAYLQSMSS